MTNSNRTTATTGIWENPYHSTMRSQFARTQYRGLIRAAYNPAEISTGGLGEWHWERMFPNSATNKTEYVVLTVLHNPMPKHHGMISYESAIAHMLVHVEQGKQCSAWDPNEWTEDCKAVEWESTNRTGWYPRHCDSYNPETREWTEYLTGNVTRNA